MQKVKINLPGFGIDVEVSAEHETDIIPKLAFWLSLPAQCPKCKKPLRFDYTTPRTFKYYKLRCLGSPSHTVNLGEKTGTHDLYYDRAKAWENFQIGAGDEPETVDESKDGPKTLEGAIKADRGKLLNRLIELIKEARAAGIAVDVEPADLAKKPDDELKRLGVDIAGRIAKAKSK